MIKQLSENEKNTVYGGMRFDGKSAFIFGTILLGGITALQSLFRETFELGTGRSITDLAANTRRKLLITEFFGGTIIAIVTKFITKH